MRPIAEQCIALDVAEVTGGPRVGRLTWKNAAPGFHVVYEVRPYEVVLRFPHGLVQLVGFWRAKRSTTAVTKPGSTSTDAGRGGCG